MNDKMSKIAFAFFSIALAASGQDKKLNTVGIDEITGLKGKLNEQEGVYKVSSPRTDLKISVDKWQMPPFMGLTSWSAFMPGMKGEAMVMIFFHYWGRGPAEDLARAVKTALQATKTA